MTQQGEKQKEKPGTKLIAGGVVALVLGMILLVFNLMNPVSNYVSGVGMVETRGPSAGSIILIVLGLVLAAFGFCRRVLAALERR
ncbi:membrane protein [Arthrobacter phage TripleJ]|uniref:Membrane protein n=1 Tax=Arthrobacter phage TripleJ TaxID=2599838 RepID=A0A5J6TFD6_9CAUD|nr:membrane protein [Arthrobacter phage TripleJ]QFG09561.1 membrane protein [Arthrobacter phage TripleJ]